MHGPLSSHEVVLEESRIHTGSKVTLNMRTDLSFSLLQSPDGTTIINPIVFCLFGFYSKTTHKGGEKNTNTSIICCKAVSFPSQTMKLHLKAE